uniref:Ig-like domain-containing protein n=1 Tax=Denticeps clupeoides TaxID=299321 RepID=A0AAY4DJL8_9TELE
GAVPMRNVRACLLLSVPGLQVEGPSGPLQVQLGDSVLLPCSVRTPVPLEELEVLWKRTDLETVVLLFQDGEVRGESQEPKFRNRTHFFTEELSRGNFSLFLTNVTPADAGMYRCSVHTDTEYGDATALIHTGIMVENMWAWLSCSSPGTKSPSSQLGGGVS